MLSRFKKLLVISSVLFTIAQIGFAESDDHWMAVVDAGSSGSRVHLYRYRVEEGSLPKVVAPRKAKGRPKKFTPGLATFVNQNEPLKDYLNEISEEISKKVQREGVDLSQVELHFLMTGGIRLLSPSEQARFIVMVEELLSSQGFKTVKVDRIMGDDEGLFSWVAVNYLHGNFAENSTKAPIGIVEFGGASIQLAFCSDDDLRDLGRLVRIGEKDYRLYLHSYDGFGGFAARDTWNDPSCEFPGDFEKCRTRLVNSLKALEKGEMKTGLNGVYQPDLKGDFVALEHFYEVAKVGGIETLNKVALSLAGQNVCRLEKAPEHGDNLCFDMSYFSALLFGEGENSNFDALGFTNDQWAPKPVDVIAGQNAVWPLGYVVLTLQSKAD